MNNLLALTVYLFLGGLLLGGPLQKYEEECSKQPMKAVEALAIMALWPAMLGAYLSMDTDVPTDCAPGKKDDEPTSPQP
jgi:hypothetical protein